MRHLVVLLVACAGAGDDESPPNDQPDTADDDTGIAGSPCTSEQAATCDENASCAVVDAEPTCTCNAGWEGSGVLCTDVDECLADTDDCDPNATCTNQPGRFDCTCNEYYRGPGTECALIDPTTFVRDVSDRPITLEFGGLGTYEVNGMGRLAFEIASVSSPGFPPFVDRTPTDFSIPDLVLRGVEAQPGSSIDDLVAWVQAPFAVDARMVLDGRSTERMTVDLRDLALVSADPTVTDDRLSELVLSIGRYQTIDDYTPPAEAPFLENLVLVQIDAIGGLPLPPVDAVGGLADQAEPLELRKIPNAGGLDARSFFVWFQAAVNDLDSTGDIERFDLVHSRFDGDRNETARVVCRNTFPQTLTVFNPAKIYGSSNLVDFTIATGGCEAQD